MAEGGSEKETGREESIYAKQKPGALAVQAGIFTGEAIGILTVNR